MADKKSGMKSNRMMNRIRKQGQTWLFWFAIIFVISVFAGLGVGSFTSGFGRQKAAGDTPVGPGGEPLSEYKHVAAIGDVTINWQKFHQLYNNYLRQIEANDKYGLTPERELEAMNEIILGVLADEALRAYGKRQGIKVTDKELKDKIAEAKAQFKTPDTTKPEDKTIVGEFQRSLGANDDVEKRWQEFLKGQGLTESEYFRVTMDQLLREKIQKSIQDGITAKKKELVEDVKKAIDDSLAEGTSFADLATLFSFDYYTRADGGEIPSDLALGLFSKKFDEEVWKLKTHGEMTPWFETEFGWERVQLIEQKPREKAQTFDEMKESLISDIRKSKKDDKYEPTDEELNTLYENKHMRLRIRHITLSTMAGFDFALFQKGLADAMPYKIEHPLVVGYRAMKGMKNAQAVGTAPTVKTMLFIPAEDYQVIDGEGIHKDRIKEAIELAKDKKWPQEASWYKAPENPAPTAESAATESEEPSADSAASPEKPASEGADANGADTPGEEAVADAEAKPADAAAAPVTDEAAPAKDSTAAKLMEGPYESLPPSLEDVPGEPRYAEAIAAFTAARDKVFRDQGSSHFYVAWCYETWLEDPTHKSQMPMTEDEAVNAIIEGYKKAVELYEYEPNYSIALAEFCLDHDKTNDALTAVDKAFEYAGLNRTLLSRISSLYDKLGDADKKKEVDAKIETAKQREAEEKGGQQQQFQIPFNAEDSSGEPIKIEIPANSGSQSGGS
jgi:hypothetical protein